jgi:hypothetical protein
MRGTIGGPVARGDDGTTTLAWLCIAFVITGLVVVAVAFQSTPADASSARQLASAVAGPGAVNRPRLGTVAPVSQPAPAVAAGPGRSRSGRCGRWNGPIGRRCDGEPAGRPGAGDAPSGRPSASREHRQPRRSAADCAEARSACAARLARRRRCHRAGSRGRRVGARACGQRPARLGADPIPGPSSIAR